MPEFEQALLLLAIGFVSGAANVAAEAGSLVALPALLLAGYSGGLANGTNRIVLFWLNLFALKTYYNRERLEFKRSLRYAGFAVPGAILGTLAMLRMENSAYVSLVGIILLIAVWSIFYRERNHDDAGHKPKISEWTANLLMFFIGFYGGFIQAGVAVFLVITLSTLLGLERIKNNIFKISILFAYLFPTSLIFVWTDNVDWAGVLLLLAGNIIGSWAGSLPFIKYHPKASRASIAALVVIMALRLLQII